MTIESRPQNSTTVNTTNQKLTSGLEKAAFQLAGSHRVVPTATGRVSLLARLPELGKLLETAHKHFLQVVEQELALTYAAEWLLDNYYLIGQALRQIEEDLPTTYYRELPKLNEGDPLAGQPRIYVVARGFIIYDECQVDVDRLERFIQAYQERVPLTVGELWALPIMLRLALLESLAQAATSIIGLHTSETLAAVLDGFVPYPHKPDNNDIVAHAIPSLRLIDSLDWQEFFERVSIVHRTLAADPSGVYTHLEFATRNHYRSIVEEIAKGVGQAEATVAQAAIDLARAAGAVLNLDGQWNGADLSGFGKPDRSGVVTAEASEDSWPNLGLPREYHVGYYLLDHGRDELERRFRYRPRGRIWLQRWVFNHATPVYLGAIGLITTLIVLAVLVYALVASGSLWLALLAGALTFVPAMTLAVDMVNGLVTRTVPPRILPKLDFEAGLPAQCRTLVAIPALISHVSDIDSLFNQLELHYLRNADSNHNLAFALLSDFSDAPSATMPEDEALMAAARERLVELNQRHPHKPFYFFHRRRLWNPLQKAWMGWERKRGKLHEFNRLLRGDEHTSYFVQLGDLSALGQIRYVITLDADTVLPREGAHRLVGTLAHPLNHAQFDEQTGRVTAGYTILQPRTAIKPTSANRSLFTRVFSGDVGIDLYTLAVSDVYQDLFGSGIYVGKGIYDVDTFEQSLENRVPENALLSHDLFEGIHGRVGLVTDVVLYEDFPPNYLVHVLRSHRWVRGDWQLLPWLFPRTPYVGDNETGGHSPLATRHSPPATRHSPLATRHPPPATRSVPNDLALIDRWKLFDNLRRSLVAPALLALLIAGWTVLPGAAWMWTLLGLLTPGLGLITALFAGLVRSAFSRDRDLVWRSEQIKVRNQAIRWLLFLAFLPYEAMLHLDAIATTLARLLITRRKFLEWTTAARTVRVFGDEVPAATTFVRMLSSIVVTILVAGLVAVVAPQHIPIAAPFILVWLLASEIAYRISRPYVTAPAPLSAKQVQELRRLARHTWLFYEHYVGPTDNWLPPDHFQEWPRGIVAHRTSPTNVGMYLLTVLAAHDLGYIGGQELFARLRSTFDTLQRLDRYRGHFLNWIDTRTLEPLPPRYVSTVDSGNLAASLIALKQGCLALPAQPIWGWTRWQGLLDTLALFEEALAALTHTDSELGRPLREQLALIHQQVEAVRADPQQWFGLLERLGVDGRRNLDQALVESVEANAALLATAVLQSCRAYTERIHHHLIDMQRDIDRLHPWLALAHQPPALFTAGDVAADLRTSWQQLQAALPIAPHLEEIPKVCAAGQTALAHLRGALPDDAEPTALADAHSWCEQLEAALQAAGLAAQLLITGFQELGREAEAYSDGMEFSFLFNEQRQVFHIGYNGDTGNLDRNYYDLLASEARIASLVAIANDDVPQSHWLHLSRPLTTVDNGAQVLLSWSGTMFEYLMPPLLLHHYKETLFDQTYAACIEEQIAYSRQKGTPWGISESGFYTFDAALAYQYRAFGVPGLGFKRGLGEDHVITPYASLLALSFQPQAVLKNIDDLTELGMWGRYGLYEAIDFTRSRLMLGQEFAIIRSFMAHHQGMILLALVNYLHDNVMVKRFHAEPAIQTVELLLQERAPYEAPLLYPHEDETNTVRVVPKTVAADPWRVPLNTPVPLVHYLANSRYRLLITNAGAGYSRWQELNLTRWRSDPTLDDWGCWLYVQDMESGALWSAGVQPTGAWPTHEETLYHPHMVEFRRRDHDIALHMTITVAPEDDVEIRRISLTNDSDQPRRLRLTTYGEVVLGPAGADLRHPAFGKLFVESTFIPELNALLFRRRPRSATEVPRFLAHVLVPEVGYPVTATFESDRARFLGRGGTPRRPAALAEHHEDGAWLSGTTGATLDPIMALGQAIELAPHATVQLAVLTTTGESRTALVAQIRRYRNWSTIERTFMRARNAAEQEMRELDLTSPQLEQIQRLLSLLFYPHSTLRADAATLAANRKGQPGLWAFGISGDYPILLVRVQDEEQGELLQEVLQAHLYWRRRGLEIDLVILNRQESNYGQAMQGYIHRLIQRMDSSAWLNQRGGIFILREDQMAEADRILLQTTARIILDGTRGSLAEQLANLLAQPTPLPTFEPVLLPGEVEEATPPLLRPTDLQFDNGLGGFTADGWEYVLYLRPGETTPAPWINVVANADFGFLVSETGGGYTWSINSGENRLTTWRNDQVSDLPAEAIYLRDEETGEVWSPTPQPVPAAAPYLVRHGPGYSIFEHHSHNLVQHLRLFTTPDAPVKIVQLRLENSSPRTRRLTVTYYAEWVLGVDRDSTQLYLIPEYDDATNTLMARNPYNAEFGERVAFLSCNKEPHGLTADRAEFLGQRGTLRRPAALTRVGLSSRVAPGLDTCAVIQLHLDLAPGASEEAYFLIGQGIDREDALTLAGHFQDPQRVESAWNAVQTLWEQILGTVQVETPDPAMNLLLNRWLLYQTLACRIWGRSALYQSSGAYGFRDQLQDVMALVHTRPDLTREHILRASRHQFEAGDVLHWWHPPSGRGVRTRISDDLLWLPFVVAHYVAATGDETILAEETPFLKGEPLGKEEEERYGHYETSEKTFTLYEHCRRALQKGTTAGPHGIPLIGGGDWNDGMNRVGIHGRGESIWLGWFLHATLTEFAALCERIHEEGQANAYRQQAEQIRQAIEYNGWDGEWYRRAYYDDGEPLGSAQNQECRIDSIAQSWAVLSRAADRARAEQAMRAVVDRLVKWDERLILLFTPPLDKTPKDPGYIKGYLPGVRENGGQYTHAALWTIWAFAELGNNDLAEKLFRLINPIYRADTPENVHTYKVEPYVISADVYGVAPHTSRGGWTWYTGSSGWMYRLGVEAILGLRRVGNALQFHPHIPTEWPGYVITYRYGGTTYRIQVQNTAHTGSGVQQLTLDGEALPTAQLPLVDDGKRHEVVVEFGSLIAEGAT